MALLKYVRYINKHKETCCHFVKLKIRYIFILQFGGYFVKFYSRQIFRPYGIPVVEALTNSL